MEHKNEAFFYKNVHQTKNVIFFKGYRSKTSGKEKEVDVKLAVDVVNFAYLDKYDSLYLFSGDADFMHALKIAENLNRKILILALENRIPNRFSYLYSTYIVAFGKKFKGKVHSKQRIKVLFVDREELLEAIN